MSDRLPEGGRYEDAVHQAADEIGFEREVTSALASLRLPDGFTDRVLARAEDPAALPHRSPSGRGKVLPFRVRQAIAGGAIAATLLAAVLGTEGIREHREQLRKQAVATQEFATATRITAQAMAHTFEELRRAGAFREE